MKLVIFASFTGSRGIGGFRFLVIFLIIFHPQRKLEEFGLVTVMLV